MLILDVVVVNVAVPSIRSDLQVADGAIQVVAVAGVAAAVTAVPTAASLASGYRAGFLGAAVLVLAATFAAVRMPRDIGRVTPTPEVSATTRA